MFRVIQGEIQVNPWIMFYPGSQYKNMYSIRRLFS